MNISTVMKARAILMKSLDYGLILEIEESGLNLSFVGRPEAE
jgi:hypothetical protein